MSLGKIQSIAILLVAIIAVAVCVAFTFGDDDDDGDGLKDAAGNILSDEYDTSRIMTVGVGTLRWTSYFGLDDKVMCIDAGDANASSWNGKAYRSLFDLDSALTSGIVQSNVPKQSDFDTYGMAVHTHNEFTTSDLEELLNWSVDKRPTLAIVCKSVYNKFTPELINGIKNVANIDLITIYEVEKFLDSNMNISSDFKKNLDILAHVFDEDDRAEHLVQGINGTVSDIRQLVYGKTPVLSKAYIAGASVAGAKPLDSSVGSYLPFELVNLENVIDGDSTTPRQYGGEVLVDSDVDVIFLDLSSTTKHGESTSQSVLNIAKSYGTSVYCVLPYFWFGYNFDNALANAYVMIYACYSNVLSFDECMSKMAEVYEVFYPGVEDGKGYDCIDAMMDNYYSVKGSKLVMDGNELKVGNDLGLVPA